MHTVVIADERKRARLVNDLRAFAPGDRVQRLDQTGPATPRLDRQPAPEFEFAFDLERLASVNRNEADPLAAQPLERRVAAPHQQLHHVGIGVILGHAAHVLEKLIFRVGPEIGVGLFFVGKIGQQFEQIGERVVCNPNRARGERRVAASLRERGAFQHDHLGAVFARGERRTHRGIARTNDQNVALHQESM